LLGANYKIMQENATTMPGRVLAVLGMHRSGTSCLTGSLQDLGVELGDCHTWNPYNKKGNRENQGFVDLHDAILNANGGSWDNPPRRVVWQPEHFDQAKALLTRYSGVELFGFKDPRALLVLDGWKSLLPSIEFVGVFRHPEAVVESLSNRSGLARERALSLWLSYNTALWREYKARPFPVLCFDEEERVFQEKVVELASSLRLTGGKSSPQFYDIDLKQFAGESLLDLPWRVKRLYRKLRNVSC